MRRILNIVIISVFICFITCCNNPNCKNKCLNYENFNEFYYNDNLYVLPDSHYDIYSKYDFYGAMHKIGYTIGVYGKVFETYVLDNDIEENILFQKEGRYFWFKDGFELPNISEINIDKLLIQKLDYKGYVIEEKEFLLENILLNDLLVEFNADANKDLFLLDYNNFLTYRIKYIYENGFISKKYDRMTIYNNNLFIEKINEAKERMIYSLNEDYTLSLILKDEYIE